MVIQSLQKLSVVLITLGSSTQANAQWLQTKDVDAFTDQTTIYTKNTGRIIAGEQGNTALVHRTKDDVTELYWNTPDGFLCDVTVMGRVDEGAPFEISASLSTDRQSVFFQNRSTLMEAMIGSNTVRFKLTDSCGGYMVAEFSGNADLLLPEYTIEKQSRLSREATETLQLQEATRQAELKNAENSSTVSALGWTVLDDQTGQTNGWQGAAQNNDFIQYAGNNTSVTYRKSLSPVGPPYALRFAKVNTYHDISFGIFDQDLVTNADSMRQQMKVSREFEKAQIRIGKKTFEAKTTVQFAKGSRIEFPNATSGAVAVYLVEPAKVEELYAALLEPEIDSVEIKLKDKKYTVPIANFSSAINFYE